MPAKTAADRNSTSCSSPPGTSLTDLHVDRSFGVGITPLTFEALKGQRFRWCFGGIQILRRHWRLMLPGRSNPRNRLNLGQRWAYLSGALQWYGDLLALLFFVFLLVGAANVSEGSGLLFRKLTSSVRGYRARISPALQLEHHHRPGSAGVVTSEICGADTR
jgi:hypothetical protein